MKVCLIGSTRFIDKFHEVNSKLTLMGHVVYSVATAGVSPGEEHVKKGPTITDHEKETLDLVHLIKLMNSDVACLITDSSAYVGTSTKREMKWCLLLGKQILLPEHFHGLDDNLSKLEAALKDALAEVSAIDTTTKIDVSKIKI